MLNVLGKPSRVCEGTTRRRVLQAGGAGLLGLSVPIQTGHRWHLPIGGGVKVTPNDWPSMGSVVKHYS